MSEIEEGVIGFIVCWTIVVRPHKPKDHYEVFLPYDYDGSIDKALKEANKTYDRLIKSDSTYIANVCRILKSTDYFKPKDHAANKS